MILILFILVLATIIFPSLWIIIPLGLIFIFPLFNTDYDEEIREYKRKKRLEECRRRRYGRKR